jgi:hypothetical protein
VEKGIIGLDDPAFGSKDEDPDDVGFDQAPDLRFAFCDLAIQTRILQRDRTGAKTRGPRFFTRSDRRAGADPLHRPANSSAGAFASGCGGDTGVGLEAHGGHPGPEIERAFYPIRPGHQTWDLCTNAAHALAGGHAGTAITGTAPGSKPKRFWRLAMIKANLTKAR